MRQEPPKSCPRGVLEAAPRRLGAKTRRKAPPDSLQTSILDHFWKDFGVILDGFLVRFSNKLDPYSRNYPLAVLGGAAPPQTPPPLRGAHLEERTVAGTPLCGARDYSEL